jgi:pimeloyl-ACP methyl ester carboxylesterase
VREVRIETARLTFAALAEGPEDGPLALCLHGFPDSAWTWRHLLPALAGAGYRAVAPFLRGYDPTPIPGDTDYTVAALGEDAAALHEALGGGRPGALIGHDWGAAATYASVVAAPERWRCAVAMAVPLTGASGLDLFSYEQMRRSWYSFLLQLPVAAEVVRARDLEFIERLWRDWSPRYAGADDVERAKACLRPEGCLEAAIEYYRANPSGHRAGAAELPGKPLLYLHGEDDGCIGVDVVRASGPHFPPTTRIEILAGVGHFLQLEAPELVNRLVLSFLSRPEEP